MTSGQQTRDAVEGEPAALSTSLVPVGASDIGTRPVPGTDAGGAVADAIEARPAAGIDEFTELLLGEPDLVAAEFAEIIAASWPELRPRPPRRAGEPIPARRTRWPAAVDHRAQRRPRRPRRPGTDGLAHQRSPPLSLTLRVSHPER